MKEGTEAGQKAAVNMLALRRVARPDDIGPVIAFLASDEAHWITGGSDLVRTYVCTHTDDRR